MSKERFLVDRITSCTKEEFDKIVKVYLREIEHATQIVNRDGPYDGGIDMTYKASIDRDYKQVQVTIQRDNLTKKISSDLVKLENNVDKHGESNECLYFISSTLAKGSIRSIESIARNKHELYLTLVDAKEIASCADDNAAIEQCIIELYDGTILTNEFDVEDTTKVLWDLIAFGNAADTKMQIIEGYIKILLYDKKQMNENDLLLECSNQLNSEDCSNKKGDNLSSFYKKTLNKLLTKKVVVKRGDWFSLNDNIEREISENISNIKFEEKNLLAKLSLLVNKYECTLGLTNLLNMLIEFYKTHYAFDISNKTENSWDNNVEKASFELKEKLKPYIETPKELANFLSEVIKECKEFPYLRKIGAAMAFSNTVAINKLDKYIINQHKVYIDANVGYDLLCFFIDPTSNYPKYGYRAVSEFFSFCKRNKIEVCICSNYVQEIAGLVEGANRLVPFTKLDVFDQLGTPTNTLYKFYSYQQQHDEFHGSFQDYLQQANLFSYYQRNITEAIEFYFKKLGIKIETIEDNYDIHEYTNQFHDFLYNRNRTRNNFAVNNDIISMLYMSSGSEKHKKKPIFVTWDKSYYKFYISASFYDTREKFHIYQPGKFVDHFSLAQINIGQDMFSSQLISLLEENIVDNTTQLINVIDDIISTENEIGLRYVNKLVEVQKDFIHTEKTDEEYQEINNEENFLVSALNNIILEFRKNNEHHSIQHIFSKADIFDNVFSIIVQTAVALKENKQVEYEQVYKELFSLYKSVEEIKNDKFN